MGAKLGWFLAVVAAALATHQYGLQGFIAALSLVVFWLLLQLNRALRVMRRAGDRPVGRVPSAVMLHAKLKTGMPMLNVVAITKSLGRKVGTTGDVWQWQDDGDSMLTLHFSGGRLSRWTLERPSEAQGPALAVDAVGAP